MTVCVAAICEGGHGLVLASDTMVTNQWLSIQFEHVAKKMTPLSETCVALTSGDALAHTELFTQVAGQIGRLKDSSVVEIVETIKQSYQQIRRKVITERYLGPTYSIAYARFSASQCPHGRCRTPLGAS